MATPKPNSTIPFDDDSLLTKRDFAQLTRFSEDYISRHISSIPHTRIGNRIRFTRQQMRDWVTANAKA